MPANQKILQIHMYLQDFCLELVVRIELTTCSLRMSCSAIEPHQRLGELKLLCYYTKKKQARQYPIPGFRKMNAGEAKQQPGPCKMPDCEDIHFKIFLFFYDSGFALPPAV